MRRLRITAMALAVCGGPLAGVLGQVPAVVDNIVGTYVDLDALPPGQVTRFHLADNEEVIYTIQTGIVNSLISPTDPRVVISNNGGVAFAPFSDTNLPAANAPLPAGNAFGGAEAIMGFWDDIGNTTGTVLVAETAVNMTQTLVIQWRDNRFAGTTDTISFEIQVPSTVTAGSPTAVAQILFADVVQNRPGGGASATIGFQNVLGGSAEWSFNERGAVGNGTVLTLIRTRNYPLCDDGGPYFVPCSSGPISVMLDGTGSRTDRFPPLEFSWSSDCPNATFDDPTSATPIMTFNGGAGCISCTVRLTVQNQENFSSSCTGLVVVSDNNGPVLHCPPPLTVLRGDNFCDQTVRNWLNSATVSDNCSSHVTLTHDPLGACGFPEGTTTVLWTATDSCGNTQTCSSTITVLPAPRGGVGEKGSLLVFPNIELRWDLDGNLVQDTFLSLTNDTTEAANVKLYFVNGDPTRAANGGERAHPGCNRVNNSIHLTANQPIYFSAATGLPAGVSPFYVLDPGTPPGRPDPEPTAAGGTPNRVLRGYMLAWATDSLGREIRFNHLSGSAMIINYEQTAAWEYLPWAFQINCVGHNQQPLDCLQRGPNGECCQAAIIPGRLDLDGFQYEAAPDQLLLEFYASNAVLAASEGRTIRVDTDLTLLPLNIDLRQDGHRPSVTKAEFQIWNANEVGFSGQVKCLSCWDQTLLSRYPSPDHFLRSRIQTNQGKARINGVGSTVCAGSAAMPLLGVAMRLLDILPDDQIEYTGGTLVGMGAQTGQILYDIPHGGGELIGPGPDIEILEGESP